MIFRSHGVTVCLTSQYETSDIKNTAGDGLACAVVVQRQRVWFGVLAAWVRDREVTFWIWRGFETARCVILDLACGGVGSSPRGDILEWGLGGFISDPRGTGNESGACVYPTEGPGPPRIGLANSEALGAPWGLVPRGFKLFA